MPDSFETYQKQGTYALQQGSITQAVELLEKAMKLNPHNIDTRLNLSSALILKKRFKDAAKILESLTTEDPHNEMFWLNLGAAYLGNPILATDDQQQRAIEAFKKAIELNPQTPNAAYNLGLVYRDRQDFQQALRWFKQAAHTFPDDKDAFYYIEKMIEKLADDGE